MRFCLVLFSLVLLGGAAFAGKEEPLPDLIARAEAAPLKDRPPLYAKIAKRRVADADELYRSGKPEQARAAVNDAVSYCDKATDAADTSGSKLKNTEIAIREMADKLANMKRTLDFEDQAPVQAAIDHLQGLRTRLLDRMFGKNKKKK
ncbi:MAG TPA: hypothetical protein VLV49_15940 [Terriglobales bacterium]|nr:hypothetical protein [Terriglobales bacterium]